jgi:hypothetical protein
MGALLHLRGYRYTFMSDSCTSTDVDIVMHSLQYNFRLQSTRVALQNCVDVNTSAQSLNVSGIFVFHA